ncbi:MAG: deoxynucleoside kinase [Zoogloeaceae bacterium]|nr:deoxynucleoside kinase [Rhodocyclaceae bacterium]MCP5237493.1 deoxynucleoside kinase [Zoogloeaceae bacterium]
MLERARHIVVEGPIGAGKTSLARRLSERLGARLVLERPEDNPFLARFYHDMERWGLATQLSFLYQRIDLLTGLGANPQAVTFVSDFLLDKDPLFAELNLGSDELTLYHRILSAMKPIKPPSVDLVIYLQAKSETLIDRVRKRGLDAERTITEDYIGRVSDCYARYFYDFDASPLFIVDTDVLNPVDREEDFDLLIERLGAMRGYREFFGYAA